MSGDGGAAQSASWALTRTSASENNLHLGMRRLERVEIGGPNDFAGCNAEAATVDKRG